ncbi:MAG: addiction module toxin RelE [Rhodospirillaceae bacterium]|nr:addiction module toxin RelE [Rhodospirillaceae bacterium]MYF87772.1 addiction module toxin RelE [Rhodospirillaceae bacterium]MYH37877.1 addiction module toxin RelE [Rhodospirillaceae bacterium]MYK15818.1 addiction module toxin RelE [Rhodospirillaceae bacterium]
MTGWTVAFFEDFKVEFDEFPEAVQNAILARAKLLERVGPQLGRPYADTLAGAKHTNMKELRCSTDDGVWRIAYAFDPKRRAVLLVAGDKSGVAERRFYKQFIAKADERFEVHLGEMKG